MQKPSWKHNQRSLLGWAIAVCMAMLVMTLALVAPVTAQLPQSPGQPPTAMDRALSNLSPLRPHPLPATLAQQPSNPAGDYWDQIQTPVVGALIWSSFPVTVYIEPQTRAERANPFLQQRSQQWINAVQQAMQEWQPLIPLKRVEQAAEADITLWRRTPPLQLTSPRAAGDRGFPLPRARSAETRYELYAKPAALPASPPILAHRMTIYIRPDQAVTYLQAAARHELGHAIGIWGHSPNPADALYFSQVRNPASISLRDINTLKRIYQQPTRLGWPMQRD